MVWLLLRVCGNRGRRKCEYLVFIGSTLVLLWNLWRYILYLLIVNHPFSKRYAVASEWDDGWASEWDTSQQTPYIYSLQCFHERFFKGFWKHIKLYTKLPTKDISGNMPLFRIYRVAVMLSISVISRNITFFLCLKSSSTWFICVRILQCVTVSYLNGCTFLLCVLHCLFFPLGLASYIEDQYTFMLGPHSFFLMPVPVLLFTSWVG